jgi:N-acetylglucosamine-6-phosphate deacetylase
MQLWGRRYDTGRPVCLEIDRGRIAASRPVPADGEARPDSLERWPWIAPGLIDLQVNG